MHQNKLTFLKEHYRGKGYGYNPESKRQRPMWYWGHSASGQ